MRADNYPDFLERILVVNPPPFFAFAWNLLRPFVPRHFGKLVQLHDGDENSCWEGGRVVE